MAFRINVGKQYNDFKSLESDLKKFEEENHVNLRIRQSHTIKWKKDNGKCLHYKDELKFHYVHYICKHGGEYRNRKRTNERTTSSAKINCPFTLKFRATKAGNQLECTMFKKDHNHNISEQTFKLDPSQRKVDSTIKEEIAELAQSKMPRKQITHMYQQRTGKNLLKYCQNVILIP